MRNLTIGALLVAAVLLTTAGIGAAHGTGAAAHDDSTDDAPENETAAEWGEQMERHMEAHMGADAAERMREYMGMSYDEMGAHMADHMNRSHTDGMMNRSHMDGMMNGSEMDGNGSDMGCH